MLQREQAVVGDAADVPLGVMPSWTTSEQNINSTGMVWRDCNRDGIIDVFSTYQAATKAPTGGT